MKKKLRLEMEAIALARVVEVIELANDLYPQMDDRLEYTETVFDLRGKAAGMAMYRGPHPSKGEDHEICKMRINMEAYAINPDEMMQETIPHEIAHLVCFILTIDKGHGERWKEVCRALGGSGKIHHEMRLTSVRKQKKFLYVNDQGREIHFAQGRHSNLRLGKQKWYGTSSQKWFKKDFVSEVIINPATGRIEVEENGS